jgi:hypothetical protein
MPYLTRFGVDSLKPVAASAVGAQDPAAGVNTPAATSPASDPNSPNPN